MVTLHVAPTHEKTFILFSFGNETNLISFKTECLI